MAKTNVVIHLKDNTQTLPTNAKLNWKALDDLQKINLSCPQQALLIFPKSLNQIKDGSLTLPILSLKTVGLKKKADDGNLEDSEELSKEANKNDSKVICTGNLMGFVGKGDISVSIHSRFTHISDENVISNGNTNQAVDTSQPIYSYNVKNKPDEDYFLYHMLQRVFSINMFNLDHAFDRQDKVMDFLLFMFPNALKNALSQGLYKEYRSQEFDDARVRGTILVNKVIRNDIPFRGRISYRTRVHSYDNTITQLVRHTIEHIKRHPFGAAILNNDSETKEYVDKIIMATPTYNPRDKEKVLKANLRPKIHPYFLKYKDLQDLCVRILRHESLKYGEDKDKVHGILFDGAWLWEEYLNTIIKDLGFEHPRNKTGEGAINMFEKKKSEEDDFENHKQDMYLDFYKPKPSKTPIEAEIILDAKYKRIDGNPKREDLFQVVTYMYCLKAEAGGFIYPAPKYSQKHNKYRLIGYGKDMEIIPFDIPIASRNWEDFQKDIQKSEKELQKRVKGINKKS